MLVFMLLMTFSGVTQYTYNSVWTGLRSDSVHLVDAQCFYSLRIHYDIQIWQLNTRPCQQTWRLLRINAIVFVNRLDLPAHPRSPYLPLIHGVKKLESLRPADYYVR